MKHTIEFNPEEIHEKEALNRCIKAEAMCRILFDCCNQDRHDIMVKISEESSKAIHEACWDNGIIFDELWT